MDRRHFLSTTMLSSIGLMALTAPAKAFTTKACGSTNDLACRELVQHHDLVVQLNAALAQKGLSDLQRQAVLASATCPFCGLPLLS